jgi:hypothetical protein
MKQKRWWEEDSRINTAEPTKEEIKIALKPLKTGKAPGLDNIPLEILKVDLEISAEILHHFLRIYGERNLYLKNGKKNC